MTKLGIFILILIFGGTAAMAAFVAYNLIWNTSPMNSILFRVTDVIWWIS
ncbi:hypothetical protein HS7_01620 [Sulfolobales archaeon HS-7]|nr:hypothetical protein HS7_01620 [Sulfolobales archaeon HS-7]